MIANCSWIHWVWTLKCFHLSEWYLNSLSLQPAGTQPNSKMVAISIKTIESNIELIPNKKINSVFGEIQSYAKLCISWAFIENTDLIHSWIDFSLISPGKGKVPFLITARPSLLWTPFFRKSFFFFFKGQHIYKLLVKLLLKCLPLSYFSSIMCWDNTLRSAGFSETSSTFMMLWESIDQMR